MTVLKTFRDVASELARQTRDSPKDSELDLNIARSSHALKTLGEIAEQHPVAVIKALKLQESVVLIERGGKYFLASTSSGIASRTTMAQVQKED